MATDTAACANCDATIGKLEQRFDWKGQVVCAHCHTRLSEAEALAAGGSVRDRKSRGQGKWKLFKTLGILLALAGLGMTTAAFWLGNNDQLGFAGIAAFVFGFIVYLGATLGTWWFRPASDGVSGNP